MTTTAHHPPDGPPIQVVVHRHVDVRPRELAARWVSIDGRGVLPSTDLTVITDLAAALAELERLALVLPATMSMMRSNLAGQPQAASAIHDGVPVPWCWDHERTTPECHEVGQFCSGEILTGPNDPTGSAAMVRDRTSEHHRQLVRNLRSITTSARAAVAIAAGYPALPLEDDDIEPTPGEDLCRSCWKDSRYAEPVNLRASGEPYYRGLCRWCGQRRKMIGGDRFPIEDPRGDPPTWMVEMKHRGSMVKPEHNERAARAIDATWTRHQKAIDGKRRKKRK